ncbi:hypothetical protein BDN72DRAFT_944205 [Pluteus cervinus]|uniref:Uncharacterized protein n=1 Tax=Pluteus cervinus TaxID=181527 RepID=A0ACD3A1P7_9AGAR|nr:hypothetical protein BDN72DRAFT_944205 [Pluteus cervinus]
MRHELSPPIARLPPEILIAIFEETLQISPSKTSAILIISWVSQHWRDTALATSALWGCIDTLNVDAIRNSVLRSRDQFLSVVLSDIEFQHREAVSAVLGSLYQIKNLMLDALPSHNIFLFVEMNDSAPAALEVISLKGLVLPDNLFVCPLPALRTLILENFGSALLTRLNCPQLRSLSISNADVYVPLHELLRALQFCPLLEMFQVDCALEPSSEESIDHDLIELRHLECLLINEDASTIDTILQHIRIPTACGIDLVVASARSDGHLPIFPALSKCRTAPSRSIRKLKALARNRLRLEIFEGDLAPQLNSKSSLRQYPDLSLTLKPSPMPHNSIHGPISMITHICQNHLQLVYLETIDLIATKTNERPTQSFWELLESFPALQALKVRQIYAESFIDYLSTAQKSPKKSLPPFRTIGKLVYEDPSLAMDQYCPRLLQLGRYLWIRMDQGSPLPTLTLVQQQPYNIPEGILEDLASSVQKLKKKVKVSKHSKAELIG